MTKILIGIISGVVSGTGMGGGTILIFLLTFFMRNRTTHSSSNKFNIFHTNINYSNYSKYKKWKHRFKISNNNINIWNIRCNNWSEFICPYRC